MRRISESESDYPEVLFVHQGSEAEGSKFFEQYWPEARAVSDKRLELYAAVGLARGGLTQMLGLHLWIRAAEAWRKGNRQTKIVGDPWRMPGVFAVKNNGAIVWQYVSKHAGDHPDYEGMIGILGEAVGA